MEIEIINNEFDLEFLENLSLKISHIAVLNDMEKEVLKKLLLEQMEIKSKNKEI